MNEHEHWFHTDELPVATTPTAAPADEADGWYNALGVAIYCCIVVLCCLAVR